MLGSSVVWLVRPAPALPWSITVRRCFASAAKTKTKPKPRPASSKDPMIVGHLAIGNLQRLAERQKNAVLIAVVDAADFDGSCLPQKLSEKIFGDRTVILAVNKADRMPRLLESDLSYLRSRFERIGPSCSSVHAVSTYSGAGLHELASQAVLDAGGKADIIVYGARGVGKSALSAELAKVISKACGVEGGSKAASAGASAGKTDKRGKASRMGTTAMDLETTIAGVPASLLFEEAKYVPTTRNARVAHIDAGMTQSLWDTPGITLNGRLAARLPPEIAAPLLRPAALTSAVQPRKLLEVHEGHSVVVRLRPVEASGGGDPLGGDGGGRESGGSGLANSGSLRAVKHWDAVLRLDVTKLTARTRRGGGEAADGSEGPETLSAGSRASEKVLSVHVAPYLIGGVHAHVMKSAIAPARVRPSAVATGVTEDAKTLPAGPRSGGDSDRINISSSSSDSSSGGGGGGGGGGGDGGDASSSSSSSRISSSNRQRGEAAMSATATYEDAAGSVEADGGISTDAAGSEADGGVSTDAEDGADTADLRDSPQDPLALVPYTFGSKGQLEVRSSQIAQQDGDGRRITQHAIEVCIAGMGHLGLFCPAPFRLSVQGVSGVSSSVRKPMYPKVVHSFPAHWEEARLADGLASTRLLVGQLRQRRPGVATVLGGGPGQLSTVVINGRMAQNRALDGDIVVVKLLPRSEWLPPRVAALAEAESDPAVEDAAELSPVDGASLDALVDGDAAGATVDGTRVEPLLAPALYPAFDPVIDAIVDPLTAATSDPPAVDPWGAAVDDPSLAETASSWRAGQRVGTGANLRPLVTSDPAVISAGGTALAPLASSEAAAAAAEPSAASAATKEAAAQAMRPVGEVVAIKRRSGRPIVAVLEPSNERGERGTSSLLTPRHSHVPKVHAAVADGLAPPVRDTLYAVRVKEWEASQRFPSGVLEKVIGPVGDPTAESAAILVDHGFLRDDFSNEAMNALPAAGWQPPPEEVARRLDLRHGPAGEAVCSVDPPGCVDIDDALHAIELARAADGTRRFEVGVHISDVGHFIRSGMLLDAEAAERGTTCYLVDQRVNMLPERLSEDVSSLHPHVERLAFSVLWQMDEHANIHHTRVAKTLIRSRAALAYKEAQARIDRARGAALAHKGRILTAHNVDEAAIAAMDAPIDRSWFAESYEEQVR